MEDRENFMRKLKYTNEIFNVCLIDDLGRELKKQIDEKIKCYTDFRSIDHLNYKKKRLDQYFGENEFDLLLFDATYEEKGKSTIDILEELIKSNPAFADISKVFIGSDIIQYAKNDDSKARDLIERVRKLPHIIYGNEHGTKLENMVRYIQSEARKKGIEVRRRMSKGTCRPELLKKMAPYRHLISENLKVQEKLSIDILNDLKNFEPTNEEEYNLIERAKTLSSMFMESKHNISQAYTGFTMICSIQEEKVFGSVNNSDKEHDEK